MSDDTKIIRAFALSGALLFLRWVTLPALICAYLIGMAVGLKSEESFKVVAYIMPIIVPVYGFVYPYVSLRLLASRALRTRPGDKPGDRFHRLLRLPWQAMFLTTYVAWTAGGFSFSLPVVLWFDKDLFRLVVGTLNAFCFGVVVSFPFGMSLEKLLLPYALEEQDAHPHVSPTGSGPFWPRQVWFLPLMFMATIFATLLLSACVLVVKLANVRDALQAELAAAGVLSSAVRLDDVGNSLFQELAFALPWVCGLVFILPTLTTWMMARRQAMGSGAVGDAIEGLAAGRISSPRWVSTDEVGDLATGMNVVLARLRELPLSLQASASRLSDAGSHLRTANDEQQQSMSRQAAALHEAQVTSEEIKRTSLMAASRAEEVLHVARRAEELGQKGEAAVEQSLTGLSDIRRVMDGMQQRLARLAESTSQIGNITEAVKDLADQSHLLAVNAAIEAARSGEHGKGFAVVAKEIRALADQSIQATRRIRGILQDVSQGIRDAAVMGEEGVHTISTGLDQMRASGDSLRELSRISQENSVAARQIATAVTQQNAGFTQIFTAIGDLSQIMESTLKRLESTQEATGTLSTVSQEVGQMARRFNVMN